MGKRIRWFCIPIPPPRLGDGPPTLPATIDEGVLLALDKADKTIWSKNFGAQLNDGDADLDGDGHAEILLARRDHFVTVLDTVARRL